MAIVQNLWLKGAKKRLGGAVLYNTSGRTIARALAAEVKNPRTPPQMAQRIKWANLVTFYRANQSWMRKAFETKRQNQSDYNKFMQLNVASNDIYLTKSEAAEGYCIVAPYRITDGSLMPIEQEYKSDYIQTSIKMDTDQTDMGTITIKDFTAVVTKLNPWIHVGDQLSLIINEQRVLSGSNAVYNVVTEQEVVLDDVSEELLADYINAVDIYVTDTAGIYYLALDTTNVVGGMSLVLSRQQSGRTLVSPQSLIMVNNEDIVDLYSSQKQMQAALKSYGVNASVFLDPDDSVLKQDPFYGIIVDNITVGTKTIGRNGKTVKMQEINTNGMTINLSGIPKEKIDEVRCVDSSNGSFETTQFTQSGSRIIIGKNIIASPSNTNTLKIAQLHAGGYGIQLHFQGATEAEANYTTDDGSTSTPATEETQPIETTQKKTRKKE